MNKQEYLENNSVDGFITWLSNEVLTHEFHIQLAASRFAPNGVDEVVEGVENVLEHYVWRSSWPNAGVAERVYSDDWATTTDTLDMLKQGLAQGMEASDENATCEWCERILIWGGVSGAKEFLRAKRDNAQLITYLSDVAPLFQLDDDELTLESIDHTRIHRFDAGLTKIHSILDDSGSPIYDSRVGAAISMFVSLYCEQNNTAALPQTLRFPSGQARGNQLRNPHDLGFLRAPALYSTFGGADWAKCMIRLGWIMEAVVNAANLFNHAENMRQRLISLQGAFFMLGYDLRCFLPRQEPVPVPVQMEAPGDEAHGNCVPTGFSAETVSRLFSEFLNADTGLPCNAQGFIEWQVNYGGVARRATARANCYSLNISEFDLFNANQDRIDGFINGGEAGLLELVRDRFPAPDERDLVCLKACYHAGRLSNRAPAERVEWLIAQGLAGTAYSANTLLSVGRSVGRHFGLIEPHTGLPTDAFDRFFDRDGWHG